MPPVCQVSAQDERQHQKGIIHPRLPPVPTPRDQNGQEQKDQQDNHKLNDNRQGNSNGFFESLIISPYPDDCF